jgi:membrane protease YdiL (CAAX protease family)
MTSCRACRAPLADGARFCRRCGAPTRAHGRALLERAATERAQLSRGATALGAACAVPLLLFAVGGRWLDGLDGWPALAAWLAIVAGAGVIAAAVLGEWRAAAPWRCAPRWLAAAVPAAALTFALAVGWVRLLPGPLDPAAAPTELPLALLVGTLVAAPVVEELLCRGVAWRAAERLASPGAALVLTAILFGFLHGMNGGYVLELPHRTAAGLVFGWLRWRSGSLAPGVLAHALHNAAALWWASA